MDWTKNLNPRHHNVGLAQGFLRFGTVYHRILMLFQEHDEVKFSLAVEMLEDTPNSVGMALTRLAALGFIFPQRTDPPTRTKGGKPEQVFGLVPVEKVKKYRNKSQRQRQRDYRARKSAQEIGRVPSVFDLGSIQWRSKTLSRWAGIPKEKS